MTDSVFKCSTKAANHGRIYLNHYGYTYMRHSRTESQAEQYTYSHITWANKVYIPLTTAQLTPA